MAGRAKIVLQAGAVLVVALLLALLGWQVFRTDQRRALGSAVSAGSAPGAPDFSLPYLTGKGEIRLSSLRGKVVVLNFWASWCLPCKDEAPILEAAWERYRDQGVVIIGIDAQDFKGDGRRFAERYGLSYPILFDGHGSILGRYGVSGFPETWFVDRGGRLVVERIQGPVTREKLDRNIRTALGTA